eukprot:1506475-Heterocapsa_arctica.AAC.1
MPYFTRSHISPVTAAEQVVRVSQHTNVFVCVCVCVNTLRPVAREPPRPTGKAASLLPSQGLRRRHSPSGWSSDSQNRPQGKPYGNLTGGRANRADR